MKILALEFSSSYRSMAIAETDGPGPGRILKSSHEPFTKASSVSLVERLLEAASVKPHEIGLLAVGLGPGSYTGIRSSLAIAQGFAFAHSIPAHGVSSLLLVAAQLAESGEEGDFALAADAQRKEAYMQQFRLGGGRWEAVSALSIIPIESFLVSGKQLAATEIIPGMPGVRVVHPHAEVLARWPLPNSFIPAEQLEPIYLREVAFVKAKPLRVL
jgi:tRNA threonylcarbamoyl adenosine modification protein YeaZ